MDFDTKGRFENLDDRERAAYRMGYNDALWETRVLLKELLAKNSQMMGRILDGNGKDGHRPGRIIPLFRAGSDGHEDSR